MRRCFEFERILHRWSGTKDVLEGCEGGVNSGPRERALEGLDQWQPGMMEIELADCLSNNLHCSAVSQGHSTLNVTMLSEG